MEIKFQADNDFSERILRGVKFGGVDESDSGNSLMWKHFILRPISALMYRAA